MQILKWVHSFSHKCSLKTFYQDKKINYLLYFLQFVTFKSSLHFLCCYFGMRYGAYRERHGMNKYSEVAVGEGTFQGQGKTKGNTSQSRIGYRVQPWAIQTLSIFSQHLILFLLAQVFSYISFFLPIHNLLCHNFINNSHFSFGP